MEIEREIHPVFGPNKRWIVYIERHYLDEKLDAVYLQARRLMFQHGLIQRGWKFDFDRAKKRFGQCRYHDKTITLSKYHVYNEPNSEITDTLLHEIAHALVPPHNGHNALWKQVARSIGCTARRCY